LRPRCGPLLASTRHTTQIPDAGTKVQTGYRCNNCTTAPTNSFISPAVSRKRNRPLQRAARRPCKRHTQTNRLIVVIPTDGQRQLY
jgi:hypothetical protein